MPMLPGFSLPYQLYLLDYLKKSGKTILIVLHDLHLASGFCDRLFLLKDGKNVAEGTPEDVLTPEHVRDVFRVNGHAVRKRDRTDFELDMSLNLSDYSL